MAARHPIIWRPIRPLPRIWLMTDERLGDALWAAAAALPPGAGIVFRHHATDAAARAVVFAGLAAIARRRRLLLLDDGDARVGRIHSLREVRRIRSSRAQIVFVSPIFATRTHPHARALGPIRAGALLRASGLPGIALGGMTGHRFKRLRHFGFHGWAAIDAFAGARQKRNAVPI